MVLTGYLPGYVQGIEAASLRPRRVSREAVLTAMVLLLEVTDWEDVQRQREREPVQEPQLEGVPA